MAKNLNMMYSSQNASTPTFLSTESLRKLELKDPRLYTELRSNKMPDTLNSGKIIPTGKREKEDLLCQIV